MCHKLFTFRESFISLFLSQMWDYIINVHSSELLCTKTEGLFGFFFFFFLLLITHHLIFVTHHSFITHHSSLKIPQFLIPHPFGTYFQLLITQFFLLFVGLMPINWSDPSVKPTRRTFIPKHFLHFFTSSLLLTEIQPTPDQTHLKHKTFSLIHFIVFIIFFISKTTHG